MEWFLLMGNLFLMYVRYLNGSRAIGSPICVCLFFANISMFKLYMSMVV